MVPWNTNPSAHTLAKANAHTHVPSAAHLCARHVSPCLYTYSTQVGVGSVASLAVTRRSLTVRPRNPKAEPTAYLLLRGEGRDRRTQVGPAASASFLRALILRVASNVCTLGAMMLAGLRVPDRDVLELARSLRDAELDATAEKLERAYDNEVVVLALTIADREAILRALDDAGSEVLAELRAVLLCEHEGRVREGLV